MAPTDAKSKFIKASTKLCQDIRKAFSQESDAPPTPGNERERYAAALVIIGQYFVSVAGKPLGGRFFELGSAIADLNVGTVHPLLRPARAAYRPPDHSQLWRARAHVVLGLEACLRSGLNQEEAAAKIARQLPSIAKLAGMKAKDSTVQTIVVGWRKEFKAGRVKNFEASEVFAEGMNRIEELKSSQDLREFATRQVAEPAKFLRVLSPST
jgi:hypothetical protein